MFFANVSTPCLRTGEQVLTITHHRKDVYLVLVFLRLFYCELSKKKTEKNYTLNY